MDKSAELNIETPQLEETTTKKEGCMCDQCEILICGARGYKTGYCGNFKGTYHIVID